MMDSINARQLSWLFIPFLLFTASPARGAENMRVAHPSLSSSVICLLIANKEGYFKEEGINVEFLSIRGEIAFYFSMVRKANEELKISGWRP